MRINQLSLTNFRSYPKLDLTFHTGATTFIGDNGSGKTNIAEAIIYLSFLASHRVSQNQPLITLGAEQAVIRAEIAREDRTLQVDLEINSNKANRARLNQNPVRSQREILGACQSVYFSPEDLDLVRGEPTTRRDFLDKLLITRSPRLAGVMSDYERILKQRNALLKTRSPQSSLIPWNEQLISVGSVLTTERIRLCEELNPWASENYANLNEVRKLDISYKSSTKDLTSDLAENKTILERRIEEVQYQEVERGVTLVGPHRDDLHLQLGQFPAKGYASHGESWSVAISLRLGAFNLLKSEGAEPILILDDIFSELDTYRRMQLMKATQIAEQTIITAAVESDLPPGLETERRYVQPGRVSTARP
ncbi:MAG TPA: DNA replication/repair protein RecF [Candidatus Nanopelagicaceae bacterium]